MQFQELTDKQWRMMQKYIPKPARTGRPRSNDRVTINGIMFVLVTGCRWREMPEKYGSKSTAHRRLQNWQQRKVWKKILSGAIKSAYKSGNLQLQRISVDSSTVPAKKRGNVIGHDGFKRIGLQAQRYMLQLIVIPCQYQ